MPELIGIDISEYQPVNLPWNLWQGLVKFVIVRASIGLLKDHSFVQHTSNAAQIGPVGHYHALLSGLDARSQAQLFSNLVPNTPATLPGGAPGVWVDVEALGVDYSLLSTFLTVWGALRPNTPIGIYTSRYFWQSFPDGHTGLIGAGHPELAKYPLWVADYQPTPPALPDIWHGYAIHQFRSKRGYLPGYPDDLDIDRITLMAAPVPVTAQGSKIGIHSINNQNVLALVQRAKDHGYRWPLVKKINDASPLEAVKGIDSQTLTLCRYINPNGTWEGCQDVGNWSADTRLRFARESIQLIFNNANDYQRKFVDYWAVQNEPDPKGHYDALGLAMIELVNEANRRGIKLALPALPQGVPEWSDMQRFRNTGLFQLMKSTGHLLDVHEGVFTGQPVTYGYGDLIPGAPYVFGAGSTNFRHRYLYSLLAQYDEVVPLVVSEFYKGDAYTDSPADQLAGFQWYDTIARTEPYLIAFCGFTIDPNDGWKNSDYSPFYLSSELLNYQIAQWPISNTEVPMDVAKILSSAVTARDASQAIINEVQSAPLYMAKVLIGVRVRDTAGNDTGTVLTVDTQVAVYAEHLTAGTYPDRAKINLNGNNVAMTSGGLPTLQKE